MHCSTELTYTLSRRTMLRYAHGPMRNGVVSHEGICGGIIYSVGMKENVGLQAVR